MKISRSKTLLILVLALLLFLAGIFWPFLFEYIISPVSAAVWVLLRIFILSIDQKYIWGILVFGFLVYIIWTLFQEHADLNIENENGEKTIPFQDIDTWKNTFNMYNIESEDQLFIKRDLSNLLTSMYIDANGKTPNYQILEKIRGKEIDIPENIYASLIQEEPDPLPLSLKMKIIWYLRTPIRWKKRWYEKKDKEANHYKMIDEVLDYLENSLEIKHEK